MFFHTIVVFSVVVMEALCAAVCPWDHKELDMTERLNNKNVYN